MLATTLFCFSLLLSALPIVSASQEAFGFYDLSVNPTSSSTLSPEERLALSGYVTPNMEPSNPSVNALVPAPVNTMVIVDDDALAFFAVSGGIFGYNSNGYVAAMDILEGGDNPFWSNFQIDFVVSDLRYWASPNTDMKSLLAWAMATFPKPSGIDVRYVLTGQNTFPIGGIAYYDTFIVSAYVVLYNLGVRIENTWQHEASHLYYCGDHGWLDFTPCIMNYWYPWFAAWCSGCWSTIYRNRFRFGSYYSGILSFPINPSPIAKEITEPEA